MKPGETLLDTAKSLNPIQKFNNAIFGGMIHTYKLNLAESLMEKFPDAESDPLQAQQAQAYGKQINDLMGGLNYEAMGRNKSVQQGLRLIGLAPDFSEGTLHQLFTAVNPVGYTSDATRPAAVFALKNVIGQVAIYAGLAEVGKLITTGKFSPDFKSFVANSILKPNFPLPNNSTFNNPTTGKTQAANLPSSEFQTIIGAFNDPLHFLQARGSALSSLASEELSNKDYYGQTINQPNTPFLQGQWNILKSQLPIPAVNALKAQQGKITPAVAAINTAGLRVTNNPTDPQTIATNQYFNNITQGQKQLGFDDNDMAQWNTVHPTKKDLDGNIIFSPGAANTAKNALLYLNNPKLQQLEVSVAQNTPGGHDPIWDLTPDARNMVLASQAKLPGQTNNFGKELSKTTWYTPFLTARDAFFANLSAQPQTPYQQQQTAQTNALKSTGPITYPDQSLYNTNKTAYYNQLDAYNNQQLAALGLPPLAYLANSSGYSSGSGNATMLNGRAFLSPTIKSFRVTKPGIRRQRIASKVKVSKTKAIKIASIKPPKVNMSKVKKLKALAYHMPKAKFGKMAGVKGLKVV
jgi:hypothetical protein